VRTGTNVHVAGVVINRQQPYTAGNIVFMTLEDETGLINVLLKSEVFESQRHTAVHAGILLVHGTLDNHNGVMHVIGKQLERLDTPSGLRLRSRDFR
jgi:error-prone DNA polymerase